MSSPVSRSESGLGIASRLDFLERVCVGVAPVGIRLVPIQEVKPPLAALRLCAVCCVCVCVLFALFGLSLVSSMAPV